jgi:nucleotide-binding universal stress UspA family protein
MFRLILVPLDGSARAAGALPVAATIARAEGGSLLLLRAIDVTQDLGSDRLEPSPILGSFVREQLSEAQAYLAGCAQSDALRGLGVEAAVELERAADAILTTVEARRVDFVVLCSHGRTGLALWTLGSVAEHVAHHAAVPVLVLRDRGSTLAVPLPIPNLPDHLLRILVPLDGSHHAEAALEPAAALVQALSAPRAGAIHLVTVLEPFAAHLATVPGASVVTDARRYLEASAHGLRIRHGGLTVTWSIAFAREAAHALLQLAENGEAAEGAGDVSGCDLIAMTTHGAGGVARWVLGSVADRVLRGSTLPTLIVRPHDPRTRE